MAESNTNLYKCLSGLLSGLTKVNGNLVKYEDEMNELLYTLGTYNLDEEDAKMGYSIRYIDDLAGKSTYELKNGIYRTALTQDTTFILPDVADTTYMHEILLTVKIDSAVPLYITFKDESNNVITPMDVNEWDDGDVVEYLCRYESFLQKWCVMPMKMS